jgi:hypothetical protein
MPARVADPKWEFAMTSQFIGTRQEIRQGRHF